MSSGETKTCHRVIERFLIKADDLEIETMMVIVTRNTLLPFDFW